MLVNLPSDKDDSKLVIIKNEPENEDRDDNGYRDGYGDDVAVYKGKAQYLWSS